MNCAFETHTANYLDHKFAQASASALCVQLRRHTQGWTAYVCTGDLRTLKVSITPVMSAAVMAKVCCIDMMRPIQRRILEACTLMELRH